MDPHPTILHKDGKCFLQQIQVRHKEVPTKASPKGGQAHELHELSHLVWRLDSSTQAWRPLNTPTLQPYHQEPLQLVHVQRLAVREPGRPVQLLWNHFSKLLPIRGHNAEPFVDYLRIWKVQIIQISGEDCLIFFIPTHV